MRRCWTICRLSTVGRRTWHGVNLAVAVGLDEVVVARPGAEVVLAEDVGALREDVGVVNHSRIFPQVAALVRLM